MPVFCQYFPTITTGFVHLLKMLGKVSPQVWNWKTPMSGTSAVFASRRMSFRIWLILYRMVISLLVLNSFVYSI